MQDGGQAGGLRVEQEGHPVAAEQDRGVGGAGRGRGGHVGLQGGGGGSGSGLIGSAWRAGGGRARRRASGVWGWAG
ncbi:hypothetical protein Cde04nite_20160 [Cellulomonas denverensis]|nr:hypothetical protein Cde04nite_20160 [Cellulomonas denverensis]